jgi:hypothetical protein
MNFRSARQVSKENVLVTTDRNVAKHIYFEGFVDNALVDSADRRHDSLKASHKSLVHPTELSFT